MPQVQVIQPIQQQPKRLRVAAYARVSSDSEDQLNSLAVQVDYYTHLIQENPNWEFAGIYTDEGITGTSTKRREQFNRLMDDCRAGLIDRVLVKSASRFARNTADALSSVRELKSLGVTVAFEKEGFDTETSNGEMLLSIICAVAQEESLSISQNMKWGIHKRMRTGNYITNATPFGYTQINHQLVPEKNNAMIVNDIFKSYLSGMSINEIAEHLNTIYPKENSKWNPRTIHAILRNEKYIGDSLYQKTYTTDSLPLKRYLNTGQRSKYYAMETHEGIISKTDYEKVQNLLAKKSITGEIDRTCVFSKKIYCSICGAICSCRQCGMWSKPMQPENMAQQIVDRLYQIQQHPEIIHNPKEQCNTRSIEVAQLDHEIHTALALPELDADAIIDKILRRAELQFNYCAAGDDDPTTMQIKRACKEFKPTDTFPESFYSSIVSKIILHLDTHIDIKLRNGQTL